MKRIQLLCACKPAVPFRDPSNGAPCEGGSEEVVYNANTSGTNRRNCNAPGPQARIQYLLPLSSSAWQMDFFKICFGDVKVFGVLLFGLYYGYRNSKMIRLSACISLRLPHASKARISAQFSIRSIGKKRHNRDWVSIGDFLYSRDHWPHTSPHFIPTFCRGSSRCSNAVLSL